MKSLFPRNLAGLAFLVIVGAMHAETIINIDFNGYREEDNPEPPTYIGTGAVGTGDIFNGIMANDSSCSDDITVTSSNLLDEFGSPTKVGVEFTCVGADDTGGSGNALGREYLFVNSGNNHAPAPFTITGLGSATTVDLYFYHFNLQVRPVNLEISIEGAAPTDTFTEAGIFTSDNTLYFANVPVTNGTVTGILGKEGSGAVSLLSGMTIVIPSGK